MKKTNTILILIAMISLLALGAVLVLTGDTEQTPKEEDKQQGSLSDYQDNYMENLALNKEIVVTTKENFSQPGAEGIYDEAFQNSVRKKIDALIEAQKYDEDTPLVIYNPFHTNTQSLYVYFETQVPFSVS